jgi:rhodanese-related sulfurtransferase
MSMKHAVKKALCGSGSTSVLPTKEVADLIKKGAFVLDVRTIFEAKKGVAPGATNIPLLRLKRHLTELPHDRTIVTYCGTGERAGKAKDILEANGFHAANGGSYTGMVHILEHHR